MSNYLIKHAWEVFRKDGLLTLIQETLKFIGLYSTPDKLVRWWLVKLSGKKRIVRNVQGSLMELNLKDDGIHRDLYLHGIREPQATRYIQTILKNDWTVVDAGANIGYYALMEAKRCKKVYAIEAGKDNVAFLQKNIVINKYNNIEAYHVAVGDGNKMIDFHINKACNWNRISVGNDSRDEQVQMVTLDSFIKEKVDFVRMDVEGYEFNILLGMDRILKEYHPAMFIEVHRDLLRDYGFSQLKLMELLASYDYSISKSYIMGRESVSGKIKDLLADEKTRLEITERGIASHIFFEGSK